MAGYDWSYWREKYVSGTDALTLEAVSHIPGAPALPTLKRRSTKEAWADQRKQFRYQVDARVSEKDTAQSAIARVDQLVDAAEIITRHIRLAKAFQAKIEARLASLDPSELKPADLANWLKISTDIERLANGMAIDRQDVTSSDRSLSIVRVVIDPKNGNQETAY